MTEETPHDPFQAVHDATRTLLATLDGPDIGAIETANFALSDAIRGLRGVTNRGEEARALLEGALAAAEDARVRLKLLEDSTARKLVALAKLSKSLPSGLAYDRSGRISFAKGDGRA